MTATRTCPECGAMLEPQAPEGLCPACLLKQGVNMKVTAGDSYGTGVAEALPLEEVARCFPQFEILDLLGAGGMGVVYKARQPQLDRVVALKVLPASAAADPEFAERFAREARALAKLNHPNIVGVYDFGQAEGLYYFVMEYVDGVNLRQTEQTEELSTAQALTIIPRICDALQYAHDEGIVHRDIKPENILLDRKGRVKIADFGLAKLLGKAPEGLTLTRTNAVMGTPRYMAPEQMDKPLSVDHRADIYSLGVVFYEMLTGELPMGRFAPPSRKVRVDVRLDEVVLKTLEQEPARRYQHASEVKIDVENLSSPRPAGTTAPQTATSLLKQVRGPAIGLIATALLNWLVLPILLLLMWYYSRGGEGLPLAVVVLAGAIPLAGSGLILWGALKMLRGQSLGMARTAAILGMLVGPGYLVGWPVGIWALVVLAQPEVKTAFAGGGEASAASGPPPRPLPVLGVISLGAAIGGLVLPVLLAIGGASLASVLRVPGTFYALCFVLGPVLELVALGCGIAARRSRPGRAGLITSAIALPLYVLVYLALFVTKPSIRQHRTDTSRSAIQPAFPLDDQAVELRAFGPDESVLSSNAVLNGDAWTITSAGTQTVRLFEVTGLEAEDCMLVYQAQMRSRGLTGKAYLEMWCRFPSLGEFFSRGLHNPLTGTTDWEARMTPFLLEAGQRPDRVRLNLVIEGAGEVRIKDISLGRAPRM
jgi:predicted Ser/Thr protein kinase